MSSDGSSRAPRPAHECFVCGPDNPIGLHLVFRLEDDACVSEFTPGPNHVGYPGVVHGGMIYSALDDVMANWLYLRGARAYTAKMRDPLQGTGRAGGEAVAVGATDGAEAQAGGDGGDGEAGVGRQGGGDRDGYVRGGGRGGVSRGGGWGGVGRGATQGEPFTVEECNP